MQDAIYGEFLPGLPSTARTYRFSASVIALLNDELHGTAVARYLLRDNLRYVRVHMSTSDYLPPPGFFFLPLPNEHTITVLLETHELWQ